jgi:hypothetical protein
MPDGTTALMVAAKVVPHLSIIETSQLHFLFARMKKLVCSLLSVAYFFLAILIIPIVCCA